MDTRSVHPARSARNRSDRPRVGRSGRRHRRGECTDRPRGNGNQRSRCDPRARFGLAQAPAPHRQQIRPLHPACRGTRRRGRLPDGRIGRAYRHDELPPRTARAVSRPARGKRILPLRPDAGANAGSQAVRTADRADGRASRTKVQRLSEPLPRNGQRLERNVLRHAVPHDGRRIEPRALHEAGANGTLYGPVQSARVRRVGRGPAAGRRRPIAADRVSRPLHGHATAGIPPFVPSVRDRADAPQGMESRAVTIRITPRCCGSSSWPPCSARRSSCSPDCSAAARRNK